MLIGDRMKQFRKERNFTIRETAACTRVPAASIRAFEANEVSPSIRTLERFCTGMDITLSEFFCEGAAPASRSEMADAFLKDFESLPPSQKEIVVLLIEVLAKQ